MWKHTLGVPTVSVCQGWPGFKTAGPMVLETPQTKANRMVDHPSVHTPLTKSHAAHSQKWKSPNIRVISSGKGIVYPVRLIFKYILNFQSQNRTSLIFHDLDRAFLCSCWDPTCQFTKKQVSTLRLCTDRIPRH